MISCQTTFTTTKFRTKMLNAIDGNGVITVADFNRYVAESGGVNVYADGDASTDGNITVLDFNIYLPNASKMGVAQIRY